MTMFSDEQIETMKQDIVGLKVENLYHEKEGDYFVLEFEGGAETSFRFMADIVRKEVTVEYHHDEGNRG